MSYAELHILDFIQLHMRSSVLDSLMVFFTRLGNGGIIWIVLALVLLVFPKTRRIGLVLTIGLLVDVVCCNMVLKPLVGRIRPFVLNPNVSLLVPAPSDFSFPSGHTAASFTAVSALYLSKSRIWIPSLIIALLISFSRLYLYVHYPSDVLAGLLLGIMFGMAGSAVSRILIGKCRLIRRFTDAN